MSWWGFDEYLCPHCDFDHLEYEDGKWRLSIDGPMDKLSLNYCPNCGGALNAADPVPTPKEKPVGAAGSVVNG